MFKIDALSVTYSGALALRDATLNVHKNAVTAFIGPSGCGKSTFIRCLNRMNDEIAGAKVDGTILYHGRDLYAPEVDKVEVRRRIGMVFQKPNPFPKSIYDNIAFGPRMLGMKNWPTSKGARCSSTRSRRSARWPNSSASRSSSGRPPRRSWPGSTSCGPSR